MAAGRGRSGAGRAELGRLASHSGTGTCGLKRLCDAIPPPTIAHRRCHDLPRMAPNAAGVSACASAAPTSLPMRHSWIAPDIQHWHAVAEQVPVPIGARGHATAPAQRSIQGQRQLPIQQPSVAQLLRLRAATYLPSAQVRR